MERNPRKGKSRKAKYLRFHKGLNQTRRLMAAVLGTSMITTNIGCTTVWAAIPETKTENTNFVFDQTELGNALIDAANGNSVAKDFNFVGEAAEDYASLFDVADGDLYELKGLEQNKGDLTVKVYARLSSDGFVMDDEDETEGKDESEGEDDEYMITGDEQIIFLFLNSSAKQTGTIEVAGNTSQKIEILSAKELKKQMKLEEEEVPAPDTADTTDTPETITPDGETTDTPDTKTPDGETTDSADTKTPDGEMTNTTDTKTPDSETTDTTDIKTPGGETADTTDTKTSEGETGTEGTETENAGSVSENSGNVSEKVDSTSEKANSTSENAGEQTEAKVSRSAHFQMFLMAPAEETPDSEAPVEETPDSETSAEEVPSEDENINKVEAADADKAEDADTADDAETTKNTETEAEPEETAVTLPEETEEKAISEETVEETAASLSGTVYESVLLKGRAAAAFTSTVAQLLGNEVALLALGEEQVINVKGEVEWPEIQTQIDTILATDPTASVKILGEEDGAVIKMNGVTGTVGLHNFKAIELESDTTFDNVTFLLPGTKSSNDQPNIVMFANGNNLTMEENVSVTQDGNYSKRMYIFGGGNEESVDQTHLQINGGDWEYIYGGSYRADAGDTYVHVGGNAAVSYLYGGCYRGVSTDNIYVEYGCSRLYRGSYTRIRGGGHDIEREDPVADATGNRLEIKILSGAVLSEVYGATNSMLHCDDIYVTVEKGARVLNSVSGGTSTSRGDILSRPANGYLPGINGNYYTAYSNIHVEFNGEGRKDSDHLYSASVHGGGVWGHVKGNIDVTVNGDVEYVYGGCNNGNVTGDINIDINGGVHAGGHNADAVIGDVTGYWYGGTVTSGCMSGMVTGNITTRINKGASVHTVIGGSDDGGVNGNTNVHVYGTILKDKYQKANRFLSGAGSVFGGGYLGSSAAIDSTDVSGTASVYVYEGSDVQGDVYGGGLTARVSGKTHVIVSGTVGGNVYGGSWLHEASNQYGEIELGYVGDTYVELNGNASAQNVYGGGRIGNVHGNSIVLLKENARVNNVYGTGSAYTTFYSGGEKYTFGPIDTNTKGDVAIQLQDRAVVDDTIYGYEIVNIEDTPTKLLSGRADVNFINSNNDDIFKRVENADLLRVTDKSNVMIDNDYKNNEQLVNVSDLVIDGSAALKLGADAHILGNYQGDAGKSATLIIPAGKCLTADGTVTDLTNISIYDLNGIVPEKAQIYVISGTGSTKENGDFSWIDERNNVHMEWNKLSASGKEKEGKKTMWWLVNGSSSQDPDPSPTPSPTPSDTPGGGSHGGHGGGSSSGSRKSSTTTTSGPAAEPTEPVAPVEPEPQPVVPEEGLPKTGEDRMNVPMAALTVGMMAAAYVLMTGRKKTEE